MESTYCSHLGANQRKASGFGRGLTSVLLDLGQFAEESPLVKGILYRVELTTILHQTYV